MENLKLLEEFESPSLADFDALISHLSTHHANQNMHLRKARTKNGERILGHLHMVKYASKTKLAGHISGPDDLEMVYEIYKQNGRVSLFISEYDGDSRELKRVIKKLSQRLLERVEQEGNASEDHYSNYKSGNFYLRRNKDGMDYNHSKIQKALRLGVISDQFAKKIKTWGFELINP